MPTSPTIDFDALSVIAADGADLIEQTEGVSAVESSGYKGFLALSQRLSQLLSRDTISPEEFDRLRDELRAEAKERNYDVIHHARTTGDAEEGATVRIQSHDDEPKIIIATSDTKALEGARRVVRHCQVTSVTHLSQSIISCTFLSFEHQKEAEEELFTFWLSRTDVTTFKGGPIPYATN